MTNDNEALRARNRAHRGLGPPPIGSGLRSTYESELALIDQKRRERERSDKERDLTIQRRASSGKYLSSTPNTQGRVPLLLLLAVGATVCVAGALFYAWGFVQRPSILSPPLSWIAWTFHYALLSPFELGRSLQGSSGLGALIGLGLLALEGVVLAGVSWALGKLLHLRTAIVVCGLLLAPALAAGAWWSAMALASWTHDAQDRRALSTSAGPLVIHGLRLGLSTAQEAERLFASRGEGIVTRGVRPEFNIETTGDPLGGSPPLLGTRYIFTADGRFEGIRETRSAGTNARQLFEQRAQDYANRYRSKSTQDTLRIFLAPGARIELYLLEGNRIYESIQWTGD